MGKKPSISVRATSFFKIWSRLCWGVMAVEVLVAPGMAADLVSFGVHALDQVAVACAGILDLALGTVGGHYKEGRLGIGSLEDVQKVFGVDVRTVVESQGDLSRHRAAADVDAIRNISEERPRHAERGSAGRRLVGVTRRPEGQLTAGGSAEGPSGPTYTLTPCISLRSLNGGEERVTRTSSEQHKFAAHAAFPAEGPHLPPA